MRWPPRPRSVRAGRAPARPRSRPPHVGRTGHDDPGLHPNPLDVGLQIGRDLDLARDERFTLNEDRVINLDHLYAELYGLLAARDLADLTAALEKAGVTTVRSPADLGHAIAQKF